MTVQQRKTIFGLSKGLNMNTDELHLLVNGLTGKESLKELSYNQVEIVIRELRSRTHHSSDQLAAERKPRPQSVPGMMTAEQQSLAWRLMYRLQELDEKPRFHENGTSVTVGERMAGVIQKELGITTMAGEHIKNNTTVFKLYRNINFSLRITIICKLFTASKNNKSQFASAVIC